MFKNEIWTLREENIASESWNPSCFTIILLQLGDLVIIQALPGSFQGKESLLKVLIWNLHVQQLDVQTLAILSLVSCFIFWEPGLAFGSLLSCHLFLSLCTDFQHVFIQVLGLMSSSTSPRLTEASFQKVIGQICLGFDPSNLQISASLPAFVDSLWPLCPSSHSSWLFIKLSWAWNPSLLVSIVFRKAC